jgi:hypothetical protein
LQTGPLLLQRSRKGLVLLAGTIKTKQPPRQESGITRPRAGAEEKGHGEEAERQRRRAEETYPKCIVAKAIEERILSPGSNPPDRSG